ncbi:MAG: glutamate-5-semialdehyde dehydrogenase, partial [Syntrophales bacterium]|nr:glutamate-5-semialdehyde dehydrogenase [Syntrophales bacterium]
MDIQKEVAKIGYQARKAAGILANISSTVKNRALLKMADDLVEEAKNIIKENARDLQYARERGLSDVMIDRLTLSEATIKGMAEGLVQIAALPDPVGEVTGMRRRPNGLLVGKRRIPLGVIGIIYESRPNVTADAAALCLKSGNAVILRGGSEAIHSNLAIARILQGVLKETGIPEAAIQIISTIDREAISEMLKLEEYIDLIIPRGGEGLIRAVVGMSRIPVLKHYKGVCHIFVDKSADIEMAASICLNAKAQRPGVCNAMETLLVHSGIAGEFLPVVAGRLREAGVVLKGCDKTRAILADIEEATEADWYEEYLDLILAVRVVDSIDE